MLRHLSSRTLRSHSQPLRLARLVAWAVLLGFTALAAGSAGAQPAVVNKAGLVVDFGGGAVFTACVDLGADGQATGEEVLAAAGYDVLMEYSAMGGAVCRINAQGCPYPDQPCWCQCMSSPCVYWAYHHLVNGQWLYSTQGASIYTVQSGAVEGWAWGEGTLAQGAQPPVYTFDQLCSPPTATPSPTATSAPPPTSTPTATPTTFSMTFPTEPWTPQPTATWTPPATATWTPSATATWTPEATATLLPSQTASGVPVQSPTWTPTPLPPAAAATSPGATPVAVAQAAIAATTAPQSTPSPEQAATPPGVQPDTIYLPALEHRASGVSPQPQALAQAQPADTPTPAATAERALVAALPASSSGTGSSGAAGGGGSNSSLPPRLDPSRHAVEWRSGTASLTTAQPDFLALATLVLALSATFAAARAAHRGAFHRPKRHHLATFKSILLAPAAVLTRSTRPPLLRPRGANQEPSLHPSQDLQSSLIPHHSSFIVPPSSFLPPPSRLLSAAIYALTAGIGLLALLNPFLSAALHAGSPPASGVNTPLLVTVLVALCFLALLFEVQGQAVSAKMIALLGVLVAINSVLRFVEVSIPGPGGFTPIFFLIVLTGYVFGGRFGFLMGALTLLVSALITGGVGPWLPGQMFTAGWMGLLAPLARPLVRLAGGRPGSRTELAVLAGGRPGSRTELAVLAGYAGLCGLFYGVVINLWFWPYMTGPADQYWQAGVSLAGTVERYAAYYLATSLIWDVFAVAGNVLLVVAFGGATLRALRRFRQRFDFEYEPGEPALVEGGKWHEVPDLQSIQKRQRSGRSGLEGGSGGWLRSRSGLERREQMEGGEPS